MECRIQKPIDIPKPTDCLIDIITGERISRNNREIELGVYNYAQAVKKEMSKEISERLLQELLRSL